MSVTSTDIDSGYWCASVTPSKITAYFQPFNTRKHQTADEWEESYLNRSQQTYKENFKKRPVSQVLSPTTRRKLANSIDWMNHLAPVKRVYNFKSKSYFTFKLAFFTATLSARQMHSDNVIKRDILRPFIDYLRKHYKVDKYVWRLEKQKNGTTHFHMIIDKYIYHRILRDKWNYYQEKLGYVTLYSIAQRNWHSNGFKPRQELFDTWPLKAQREAYITGSKEGYINPNSTDIHSFRGIKNIVAYISKYMTKYDKNNPEQENSTVPDPDNPTKDFGRAWASSEQLSKIKNPGTEFDTQVCNDVSKITSQSYIKRFDSDFYHVYYASYTTRKRLNCAVLNELIDQYIRDNFPPG